MKKFRTVLAVFLTLALFIAGFLALQRLLMPKYAEKLPEGAFVAEYYGEEKDHDVIFIGDCEVYSNFSPAALWEKYGINSFIRGSADQYVFQSYYLLEDTFLYETPKVVVYNVQALQYDASRSEEYNRMTLDGMRWSKYKVASIFASMTEGENFADYVFPILRYHDRWKSLGAEDFKYYFAKKQVTFNGYYMSLEIKPAPENTLPARPTGVRFGERAWEYLDKMADACEARGVTLLLIKAPSLYPEWHKEWDEEVRAYAAKRGLTYLNLLEKTDEIGLDYSVDTADGGYHLNLTGAEKCAEWLGGILSADLGLEDRRGEEKLSAAWETKLAAYREEIRARKEKNGSD